MTTETINKINRILSGLTNCGFEFKPLNALDIEEWNQEELRRVQTAETGAPRFVTGESGASIGFPVRAEGTLAGLAVIKGLSDGKPGEEITALAELLSAVLGSRIAEETEGANLKSFEEKLTLQTNPSNVTQLRPTRLSRVRQLRRELEAVESQPEKKVEVSHGPLLIDADSETAIARTAFEMHERSGRWAFLSLCDLSADTLETRENLKALGGITLFINDLSALSTAQQIRLAEYLAIQPASDMPQVIAGLTSMEKRHRILPLLLGYFTIARRPATPSLSPARMAEEMDSLNSTPITELAKTKSGHLIPFDLRLLDPDQAPVH